MSRLYRRRPRYGSFLMTGAIIGFATSGVLLQVFSPSRGGADRTELSILLTAFLAGIGALLAGGLAVLLDGRNQARRRAEDDAGKSTRST